MLRPLVSLLLACCTLAACGSEQERTLRAPAAKTGARPSSTQASGRRCQSTASEIAKLAQGPHSGVQVSKRALKALKALRRASKSDKATVLCASDVDRVTSP